VRTRFEYVLERRQWLPLAGEPTFGFFADPGNLARITPPWLGFRTLTPPPVTMGRGLRLEYRLRVLGIPMRWRSLISVYEPPHTFRDVQLSGPYRRWEHTHRFREVDGGTLVLDRVVYELPWGPVGALVHAVVVRRRLREIFDYRQERIAALLIGAGAPVAGAIAPCSRHEPPGDAGRWP
jgi:ligand-binding SRPBCC domain-containing protein